MQIRRATEDDLESEGANASYDNIKNDPFTSVPLVNIKANIAEQLIRPFFVFA
jgi:hypothetical protein